MMISTKGRYALQIMAYLAEQNECEELIPLRKITEKQGISQKYAESIMTMLSKAGMVESASGKHGGYKLVKKPEEYTVNEILVLADGNISLVSCQGINDEGCEKMHSCYTFPFWTELNSMVVGFLENHTLADLINQSARN